jgi:hypothetical protein
MINCFVVIILQTYYYYQINSQLSGFRLICATESRLEGVNRRNLKIINFEHALHPGLGLEINNSGFEVRKIFLLAMSCSINVDNFGSKLKTI